MILADNCFDQFFEYANGTKSREGGVIELIARRPKMMNLGRKSSAPKESPKPASSFSVSGPELLTQWKEKGFKQEFVKKRTVKERTSLIRAMCSFVSKHCKECKNHEFKCLDSRCVDVNPQRVTSLFTTEEIDTFMKKRQDVAMVFGNPMILSATVVAC